MKVREEKYLEKWYVVSSFYLFVDFFAPSAGLLPCSEKWSVSEKCCWMDHLGGDEYKQTYVKNINGN